VTKIINSFFEKYNSNGVSGVSMLRGEYDEVLERVEGYIQEEIRGISPADERRFGIGPESIRLAREKIIDDIFMRKN